MIEDAKKPDEVHMSQNIDAINKLADSGNVNVYTMFVPNAVCVMEDNFCVCAGAESKGRFKGAERTA